MDGGSLLASALAQHFTVGAMRTNRNFTGLRDELAAAFDGVLVSRAEG